MSVNIRLSTPEDVYKIRKVQKETWLATYPNKKEGISLREIAEVFKKDETPEGKTKMEERKKRYSNPSLCTWVAELDGGIIGFCVGKREAENNRITALYVLPNHQRRGLGGQLIRKSLEWLGKEQDTVVNVATYNFGALGFYKKFGFTETGKTAPSSEAAKLPCGKIIPEITLVRGR